MNTNALANLIKQNRDVNTLTYTRITAATGLVNRYTIDDAIRELFRDGTLVTMRVPSKSGKKMMRATVHKDNVAYRIAKGGKISQ